LRSSPDSSARSSRQNQIIVDAKEMVPVRKLLAVVSLCLLGLFVFSGLGQARPAARTHFVITSGTVTIVLSSDLLGVFAADNATLTAGGGATMTVTKAKQSILTLPVVGGLKNNAVIELASNCRCVGFRTRGTLTLTGNGKTMPLARPYININSLLHYSYLGFRAGDGNQAPTDTRVVEFPLIGLPHSLSGTTFTLTGLVGKVDPNSRGVFKGYEAHLGDPGTGAAPHYPTDRAVTFGTVSIKLKLQPLS
jgi:hypothetical protein